MVEFFFFLSNLPFLGLVKAAKHSSQVSLELHLLRGEDVENEAFTKRERGKG